MTVAETIAFVSSFTGLVLVLYLFMLGGRWWMYAAIAVLNVLVFIFTATLLTKTAALLVIIMTSGVASWKRRNPSSYWNGLMRLAQKKEGNP